MTTASRRAPRLPGPPRGATPATLPTYALYGEQGRTQATDWLHCERIAERSQRHGWEIAVHRHESLFQILHIQHGSAQAWLDTGSLALAGPCVLLVPALVPHGFVFSPDIQGTVVTVLEPHLLHLLQAAPPLVARLMQPSLLRWPAGPAVDEAAQAAASALDSAVAGLQAAFASTQAWRDLALDAALLQLAVVLGRLVLDAVPAVQPTTTPGAAPYPGARPTRAPGHVQRFRALVEARFRQQPALTDLAHTLGITPTQLNRVCHQVLGHSALGVLHARLVLEAQRDLAYTTRSIKQIGGGLGFADAGYFTRFFQRQTGHTPSAWRAMNRSNQPP